MVAAFFLAAAAAFFCLATAAAIFFFFLWILVFLSLAALDEDSLVFLTRALFFDEEVWILLLVTVSRVPDLFKILYIYVSV